MGSQITIGGVVVDVILKDIKNVHLSVYPPTGRVRISAPKHMKADTIRLFAISKLPWIRQQQRNLNAQARESAREYLARESHYVWGKRHLLKVVETASGPVNVAVRRSSLVLTVRPRSTKARKEALLGDWYRLQVRTAAMPLIAKWEPILGVQASRLGVRRMKTKWGSCNPASRSLLLNQELAKKPPEFLEYIVVHELMHLLEPTHSARFVALMDQYMPKWQFYRDELNRLPVGHEEW
jgi:predicted metal-dependent hydrolase